jgi:hypothetical protein
VRIPSHGASGTIIVTRKDYTLILSCAHAFQGQDRLRRIVLDVPMAGEAPRQVAPIKLLAVQLDEPRGIDLSLILLPAGPMPYCAPVAPEGERPSQQIWSVGYDRMGTTSVKAPTTLVEVSGGVQYTKERPVPGRSGGGLIDAATGHLRGVVIGYEVARNGRGMYVSHTNILNWLKRYNPNVPVPRSPQAMRLPGIAPLPEQRLAAPPGMCPPCPA